MTNARVWLTDWFAKQGGAPEPGADYFEGGFLDSLGAVRLVADIEKEFGVRFTDSHYQEKRFATLDGLAALVDALRAAPK